MPNNGGCIPSANAKDFHRCRPGAGRHVKSPIVLQQLGADDNYGDVQHKMSSNAFFCTYERKI
jgi:hypothetical protein